MRQQNTIPSRPSPVRSGSKCLKASPVVYSTSAWQANKVPGVLEWGDDDVVRFFTKTTDQTGYSLKFELTSDQVMKAKFSLTGMRLTMPDRRHYFTFSDLSDYVTNYSMQYGDDAALGGVVMAEEVAVRNGLKWWYRSLKRHGVKTQYTDLAKTTRRSILFALLASAILGIYIAFASKHS